MVIVSLSISFVRSTVRSFVQQPHAIEETCHKVASHWNLTFDLHCRLFQLPSGFKFSEFRNFEEGDCRAEMQVLDMEWSALFVHR